MLNKQDQAVTKGNITPQEANLQGYEQNCQHVEALQSLTQIKYHNPAVLSGKQ